MILSDDEFAAQLESEGKTPEEIEEAIAERVAEREAARHAYEIYIGKRVSGKRRYVSPRVIV